MRLSLGAIIGIVSESAAAAPVLGAVISVMFFGFFAEHHPYAERSDNRLSIALAFSLVLFFIAALMIKVDATSDDEDDQEVFGMLLVIFLCAGPAMSAVEVFWDWLVAPRREDSGGAQVPLAAGRSGGAADVEAAGADGATLNALTHQGRNGASASLDRPATEVKGRHPKGTTF